nr:immunoglobulin light chain junction region [Macaca mulatta]MOV78190.1 immunoglobulin light chain junction region [Macaca mulatta]MOV78322.1 immunoglobulin light chain junction region [Macaca mulatta]MOV78350.1 immunoglobulin light chain junction region [Macaca mulatta]MOV78448.1 immunoglobulin light chain junction region [Macaca mulatta]
CQQYNSEPRTF